MSELNHYGVLGMKWGKRKTSSGSRISSLRKKLTREDSKSEDHKKVKELRKKRVSEMSNSELKQLTTRLQLETQYRDLKKRNVSTGQKMVNDILVNTASQTLSNVINKQVSKGIEKVLKG